MKINQKKIQKKMKNLQYLKKTQTDVKADSNSAN
jgi:hypothetical protein